MNATSRAILQSVVTADSSLTAAERMAVEQALAGGAETSFVGVDDRLMVTQKAVAKALSVSRVTVWRMTKDKVLHPVEVLPGTWRYLYREIEALARAGCDGDRALMANDNRRAIPA